MGGLHEKTQEKDGRTAREDTREGWEDCTRRHKRRMEGLHVKTQEKDGRTAREDTREGWEDCA